MKTGISRVLHLKLLFENNILSTNKSFLFPILVIIDSYNQDHSTRLSLVVWCEYPQYDKSKCVLLFFCYYEFFSTFLMV